MTKPRLGVLFRVILLGFMLIVPGIVLGSGSLILSEVHLVGTNRLTTDDLVLHFRSSLTYFGAVGGYRV